MSRNIVGWLFTPKLKLHIPTPDLLDATATSQSTKCIWITLDNTILVPDPLGVLERHTSTTSHLLRCSIRITRRIIKTKTFSSFLE